MEENDEQDAIGRPKPWLALALSTEPEQPILYEKWLSFCPIDNQRQIDAGIFSFKLLLLNIVNLRLNHFYVYILHLIGIPISIKEGH
jgi:hypothetical protein